MSSFNLQPGRVGRIAILANLVGDKLKQEVLSAATLNSILGMAAQPSCKFLDMLQTYRTMYVVRRRGKTKGAQAVCIISFTFLRFLDRRSS